MSKLLRIREYNPSWALEYKTIETFLEFILDNNHTAIYHIGSTSVKGMFAKPIIDIDIAYIANFELIKQSLVRNNYQYEGEKGIEHRHAFRYLKDDLVEHHLYVIKEGKGPLIEHLALKEALQNNPVYRKQYSELKQKLIKSNNQDRELYTNSKTDLIKNILLEVK